jgi:hypothetical protein
MASIRGKIRARTERRYAGLPLEWASRPVLAAPVTECLVANDALTPI